MIITNQLFLWFISLFRIIVAVNSVITNERGVREFLDYLNEKSAERATKLVNAQWQFETNNTENAKRELFEVTSDVVKNAKLRFVNVINSYPWRSFSSPDIRRQLKLYSEIGTLALPPEEFQQFQRIISDIEIVQQNTTICDYFNKTKCDLHLNTDIKEKLESSRHFEELSHLWRDWREATEPQLMDLLDQYIKLCNRAAVLNNYTNFKDYSLRNIEMDDVKQEMNSLWESVQPLYQQIHAYVRRKLRSIYGGDKISSKGLIPAHLLGNIWSENWSGIVQEIIPFPEEDNLNFTSIMISKGYNLDTLHHLAEDFFVSMGFSVPAHIWFNESANAAKDTSIKDCHHKIFNFYNNNIRIKDCDKVSIANYLAANRLLSKAEYMLQYSHQPYVYQSPADPALEEAVNNVITMSASTYHNLKKIGLYEKEVNEKVRLNRLFKLALAKITLMPFILVQEFWRWEIYSGKSPEETRSSLNGLREKIQGISTFEREPSFNPGGLGSVFSKLSLVHHFLGNFLEFQIYESLCQTPDKNDNDTLDECNLSENKEAGLALRQMMSLGSSKTLKEALKPVLKEEKINSKSLLKFFEPLMDWLRKENEQAAEYVGWETSKHSQTIFAKKTRRKRSLKTYSSENIDEDTDSTPSREPDRFQRLIHKRSKDDRDDAETSEREWKSSVKEEDQNEQKSMKGNNALTEEKDNLDKNVDKTVRRSIYSKKQRSLTKSNKNLKENSKESAAEEEKGNDTAQKSNKLTSKSKKRHTSSEHNDQTYATNTLSNKEDRSFQRRSSDFESSDNLENNANSNSINSNTGGVGGNNNKMRYTRKARKKQRRSDKEGSARETWEDQHKNQYQKERTLRNAQWHTNTKKDISRLLHSFGFAVESDDKEKIKELKKKLKGDSNSDLKSNLAKDNTYESLVDYSRIKSGEERLDAGEDKGMNKLWSMKSYMADNAKILQSNPSLQNKDGFSSSHLSNSMLNSEEKLVGKKETSEPSLAPMKEGLADSSASHMPQNSDSALRHLNIDVPSLQALLKNADFNSYGQKSIYAITPEMTDNKGSQMNQMMGFKTTPNKYNTYSYKYTPSADTIQFKDKKEFRDDLNMGNKSPYIIILGQVTPDMKERLMQEKGVTLVEANNKPLQSSLTSEEKKLSDKRGRASEQIYIVPIDLKNTQHHLLKTNHYAEQEHEAGHDPNTERDRESEEEQLHPEDNSKLEDKSNFYKGGKDSSSEFIISWNNDKNRKIVKRSKREHKKEIGDDSKLKVVRLAPMKESILEGLLGKSFDHSAVDDKNVKILIHDGLLNGGADLPSTLTAASAPMGSSVDQSQSAALQPSSSLSSLASSVITALSPKGYSQVAKSANQRQDSDLEEDNMKENAGVQAVGAKEQKEEEMPYFMNPGLRCNTLVGKKKGAKIYSDDDPKRLESETAAKGDDACCKKIILTPCPPKCPGPCPCPCPCPCPLPCPLPCPCPCPCPGPCPCPCPDDCCKRIIECPPVCCKDCCPDLCCKKPSECSLVNCQFKITKAKKPHERLTIMIYDRINPPAELPEPYDALAVISEILQRIQCCPCKPCCQLTEEDPDYPANDNTDQLKGNPQQQENKAKIQELSGEIPILGSDSPEEDETDDNAPSGQNSPNSADEDKYQPKEKATPAIDQLTVFNKDKLKPVFIELKKVR